MVYEPGVKYHQPGYVPTVPAFPHFEGHPPHMVYPQPEAPFIHRVQRNTYNSTSVQEYGRGSYGNPSRSLYVLGHSYNGKEKELPKSSKSILKYNPKSAYPFPYNPKYPAQTELASNYARPTYAAPTYATPTYTPSYAAPTYTPPYDVPTPYTASTYINNNTKTSMVPTYLNKNISPQYLSGMASMTYASPYSTSPYSTITKPDVKRSRFTLLNAKHIAPPRPYETNSIMQPYSYSLALFDPYALPTSQYAVYQDTPQIADY